MVGAGASWRSVTKFIYRRCHNFENGVSTPNCDIFEVH